MLLWVGVFEFVCCWLYVNYVMLILCVAVSDCCVLLFVYVLEFGLVVLGDGEVLYNNYYYLFDLFVGLLVDCVVMVDDVFGDMGWLLSELYK